MSEPQITQASIGEQCDVCGQDVPKDDMVKQELTVAGAMCPTAMTFHTACYEKAAAMLAVCDEAARAPASERPLFTATIGLERETRRAMRANFRGLPNDSR